MARRKTMKVERKPNYVVQDLKNPPEKQVLRYRRKRVGDHLITLAVLKKEGPRGGRTVVTSVWHPKTERKSSDSRVTRALKASRKAGKTRKARGR